jgi:phosphocarrier protein HPr
MTSKNVTVQNSRGIHLRPSSVIAKALRGYQGQVSVGGRDGLPHRISASPLVILSLGLQCGDTTTIQVEGPNEQATCDLLADLFSKAYDFE